MSGASTLYVFTATFTLRDDGTDTPVFCAMSLTHQQYDETLTCKQGGGATHTISPGSSLSFEIAESHTLPGTSAAEFAVGQVQFGWRATTP